MSASLATDGLSKTYPGATVPALDDLSISVATGEVYGFLGANGAGKSTTIRLLLNFIQPTKGTAQINGLDVVREAVQVKRHTGYLAGDVALYQKCTGRELLDFLGSLQGGVDKTYRQKLEKRFEADLLKPIRSLSKGNRQKIGILQALMHRPDVLILDEPTSGLDPLMQEAFYDSVREAKNRGAAVLMSSHNLTEAQRVCDRVGIIKHGKLVREQAIDGSADLLKPTFRVVLAHASDMSALKRAGHLSFVGQEAPTTATVRAAGSIAEALASLSRFDIHELTTQQVSLEDEFLEFYEDKA